MNEGIKLTSFSHGAGCGCKLSPKVLTTILESNSPKMEDTVLVVVTILEMMLQYTIWEMERES
jgi:selenophosphate synthase